MKKITRREFVQTTAVTAAGMAITPVSGCATHKQPFDAKGFPTVKLGKTGTQVPLMGFGCGSRWMSVEDDDLALGMLEHALDNGLYYWDTASSYGNDRISSEERIGKILPGVREKVFLVTKTGDRDADEARRSIERSLERLRTDYIDLLHVHSIRSVDDAEQLGKADKVFGVLEDYKKQGIIRNTGFTGHTTSEGMKRAATLHDFDVMMMALNHQVPDGSEKFEEGPAPYAMKKGMGVVAMKVVRPRETIQELEPSSLIRYALSLKDFHMINLGIDSQDVLEENIALIREFKPMEQEEMQKVRIALEPFYHGKNLAWMHPAYVDGHNKGLTLA